MTVNIEDLSIKDMELIFIAFDIIYVNGETVANKTLKERQYYLKQLFKQHYDKILKNVNNIRGR